MPETLSFQYRVAKSYANSPELRVTWLSSMAKMHQQLNNWSEVAMCVLHAAAIISEHVFKAGTETHLITGGSIWCCMHPSLSPY